MSATGAEAERIEFEHQAGILRDQAVDLRVLAGMPILGDGPEMRDQVGRAFERLAETLELARGYAERAGLCTPATPAVPPMLKPADPQLLADLAEHGRWADPTSDPLADVRAARDAVYQGAGQENMTDLWVTPGQLAARGHTFEEAKAAAAEQGYTLRLSGGPS